MLVGPFGVLSGCIDDQAGPCPVLTLLQHFWDRREQPRAFLDGALYRRALDVLSRLLLARIRRRRLRLLLPDELAATTLAALQLSILRSQKGVRDFSAGRRTSDHGVLLQAGPCPAGFVRPEQVRPAYWSMSSSVTMMSRSDTSTAA